MQKSTKTQKSTKSIDKTIRLKYNIIMVACACARKGRSKALKKKVNIMYFVADVIVIAFIAFMLYRGIKKGFINTFFTLVTALLWIVLAAGISFALMYFVYSPLGWMHDIAVAFSGAGEGLSGILDMVGIEVEAFNLYLAYAVVGIIQFVPLYVFTHWVGKKWAQFINFARRKALWFKIIDSTLGGLVNFAICAVFVLGFFWVVGVLEGSGLFGYTHEVLSSAPFSHLIYDNNPLYMIADRGAFAETVANILNGTF